VELPPSRFVDVVDRNTEDCRSQCPSGSPDLSCHIDASRWTSSQTRRFISRQPSDVPVAPDSGKREKMWTQRPSLSNHGNTVLHKVIHNTGAQHHHVSTVASPDETNLNSIRLKTVIDRAYLVRGPRLLPCSGLVLYSHISIAWS